MDRVFFIIGCVLACLAVAAGAFAAHFLERFMEPELLAAFETGVRYQMYHALGLLALAWAAHRWPEARLVTAAWLLVAGVVLFSGSLYALAVSGLRSLGMITPIGGIALLAGWFVAAWRLFRRRL